MTQCKTQRLGAVTRCKTQQLYYMQNNETRRTNSAIAETQTQQFTKHNLNTDFLENRN